MHLPLIELQICGLNQTAVLPLGLLQTQVPGISHGHGYHQRLDVVKIFLQVPLKVFFLFQQLGPLNHFLQVFQQLHGLQLPQLDDQDKYAHAEIGHFQFLCIDKFQKYKALRQ